MQGKTQTRDVTITGSVKLDQPRAPIQQSSSSLANLRLSN
jgi:hypothetical protein